MTEQRRGLIYGIAAYGVWGLFPLYWPLLEPAGALEILACRMAWSLVSVLILLAARRHWSWIPGLRREPRKLAVLGAAATLVTVNWGTYIWAVNAGHVIETSLGYFLNPLVTIVFGVVILHERLRPAQWLAVGIGTAAVIELAAAYGHMPWIALVLAATFGSYGLCKKLAQVPAQESMTVESAFQFLPAFGYLIFLQIQGTAVFGHVAWHVTALLMFAGVVTLAPLLFFAGATNRLPLSTVGLLQFLTPILQLACGVFIVHEHAAGSEWVGFGIVWIALIVLSWDGLRHAARSASAEARSRPEPAATPLPTSQFGADPAPTPAAGS